MINYRLIFTVMGYLLMFNGLFMFTTLPFSFAYEDGDWAALGSAAGGTMLAGLIIWLVNRKKVKIDIKKREGYLIVSLGWVAMSLFGALPYFLTGAIPSYTDAFFETISGFTTTGASVINDIESLPKSILFWRSLTHWIGGMGIIVLTIAIMPILGFGGMQLFVAEVPGLSPDKLHPRIKETAKRLWLLYVALTTLEAVLLIAGDMDVFDAVCHSMATIATGGFSTKQASMAHYSPYIQYVVIVFMFLAGVNFSLHYFTLKGNVKKLWRNEEFRFYLILVLIMSSIIALALIWKRGLPVEQAIRDSLFQVIAIITTTGFVSADYENWTPFLMFTIFVMMFFGACAGSTGGGMKMIRVRLLLKNSALELKRLIHPRAIIPLRISGKTISPEIIANVLAFFFFYIIIFVAGSVVMSMLGLDFLSSIGSVASCLSNVGPGIGSVGPMDNYAHIPDLGKWVLSFLMLCGRLEIFTILIMFSATFWKKD